MKIFLALPLLFGGCLAIPYQYENGLLNSLRLKVQLGMKSQNADYVDPDYYYDKALNTPMVLDERVKAPRGTSSPSGASALAYLNQIGIDDDICGKAAKAFLENILNGSPAELANAEATKAYIVEYNAGARPESGSACEAAANAWMEAKKNGKDPVVESAVGFMKAHKDVNEKKPCATAGASYLFAILEGKAHNEAVLEAFGSFADAFVQMFNSGNDLRDDACTEATKAFFNKVEDGSSKPTAAAMFAFMDKAFRSENVAFDPICWKSANAFFASFKKGNDEITSIINAADTFIDEFAKGSKVPADSPCNAATKAYYANAANPPSPQHQAAMEAFIDKMIGDGTRNDDPVCTSSAKAYIQAFKNGATNAEANLAAAEAFFGEYVKGSTVSADSPCAAATSAYWSKMESPSNAALKAAMESFVEKLVSGGNARTRDPMCEASALAYISAWKAGRRELDCDFAAAEAFFDEFAKGSKMPADSPCAAAALAYNTNNMNPASPHLTAAMDAFMSKMIGDETGTPDTVCSAATKAYWTTYRQGKGDLAAITSAAEALASALEKGMDIPVESPCSAAAKAYYQSLDNAPSKPVMTAMQSFMTEITKDGKRSSDPACSAALKGYLNAYKNGLSETKAALAAAESFLEAFNSGLDIPVDSACASAAKAYNDNLDVVPSGPLAEAMISFIDTMISSGNKRASDPVCSAATKAFFRAYKNGDRELTAVLKAAKDFLSEYKNGAKVPADSACTAAAKIYFEQVRNKPSPASAEAMLTFLDESIKSDMNEMDPVCATAAEAYVDAYIQGAGEAEATDAAGVAFLKAAKESSSFSSNSPCGKAAETFMNKY